MTKVVGNFVAILIPFTISVLVALLTLDASPYVSIASSNVWPAFLIITGVTFLFILSMVSLGICISSFTKQSTDSIVLAFFVWTILVLAIPKVSPMIADIIYPVESASVFDSNKRMIAEDIDHELVEEREALRIKCFEEYRAPESDMHTSRPMTEEGKQANAKFDEEFAPVAERYQRRLADKLRQIEHDYTRRRNVRSSLAMNLSRISPICSYTYILCEISGTGVTEPDNFTRNAQRYQDQLKQDIYDKVIIKRRRYGASYEYVEGFDASNTILPDMTYTYPTVTQALQTSRLDILLLGLFTVLFCSLAFMRLNKYDVR
jgi:ABC-type transport system involved in multi-copper enzyme maturation permease subunit